MSNTTAIDYESLAHDALRGVVKAVLKLAAKSGLPGDHHFYISFNTRAPGVELSKRIKEKYPSEMTIVLQHRFWDLAVTEENFTVKLTFDGIPERLVVPFSALKVFFDPSARYGLQFDGPGPDGETVDPRRSLTMDAAYDSIGGSGGDIPRATPPKRTRAPRKAKTDKDVTPFPAAAVEPVAARLAPRPAIVPTSAKDLSKDGVAADSDAEAAQPASSAQIVSLDAFRKK